jgi:hypothetical protein
VIYESSRITTRLLLSDLGIDTRIPVTSSSIPEPAARPIPKETAVVGT